MIMHEDLRRCDLSHEQLGKEKEFSVRNGQRSLPIDIAESAEAIAIGSAERKLPEKNTGMNQDATN